MSFSACARSQSLSASPFGSSVSSWCPVLPLGSISPRVAFASRSIPSRNMEKNTIITRYTRNLSDKIGLTLLCLAFYACHIGFLSGSSWQHHVLFSFCHANVFHLLVNLWVLWQTQNRIPVIGGLLVSIAASYLPMYVAEPTMGLSGFLFASFGIMWGRIGRPFGAVKAVLPFMLLTMLLSHVNGLLHLYSFVIGYACSCAVRVISFCRPS